MNAEPLRAGGKTLPFFLEIEAELGRVEAAIEGALATGDPSLAEVANHLLKAGGKRIRPALVLLCSRFDGRDLERVIPVAAAVELIHMATLVHDDVVDRAAVRRGLPTINARWSNQVSVLTGDYLFAKAFSLLAHTGNNRLVRHMADLVFEMSQGELVQLATHWGADLTEEQYLERIGRKTAYFIAESCRAGALVAGAAEGAVQALYNFGLGIGLSFQITDDLLDFTASQRELGKPVMSDLRSGILTLPVLHALRHSPRGDELRAMIARRALGDEEVARVKEILEQAGSFEYARGRALALAQRACEELAAVPELTTRPALLALAEFVIHRQF